MAHLTLASLLLFSLVSSQAVTKVTAINGQWSHATDAGRAIVKIDGPASTIPAGHFAVAALVLPEGEAPFPLGTYSAEFKLVSGASDQTAGLVFNLQPNGEYHYVRYNTKDGNVALWRFRNGAREVVKHGEAHEQLPLGAWHTISLTVKGRDVSAVVNGKLKVDHQLEEPVTGKLGFWTKPDSVTHFSNVKVTR
jgi:hypothetical protein